MQVISHRVTTSEGTLEFITRDVNNTEVIFHPDHPWLNDIRSMSKMLEGEIDLPHIALLPYNAKGDPRRWGLNPAFVIEIPVLGTINYAILETDCDDCRDAISLRHRYKQEQILSKES